MILMIHIIILPTVPIIVFKGSLPWSSRHASVSPLTWASSLSFLCLLGRQYFEGFRSIVDGLSVWVCLLSPQGARILDKEAVWPQDVPPRAPWCLYVLARSCELCSLVKAEPASFSTIKLPSFLLVNILFFSKLVLGDDSRLNQLLALRLQNCDFLIRLFLWHQLASSCLSPSLPPFLFWFITIHSHCIT